MSENDNSPKAADASPLAAATTVQTHGDEDMTAEQRAVLRELSEETGEEFDASLTREQADERIAYLKDKAG